MTSEAATTVHVVALHGNGGGGFRFSRLSRPLAPQVEFRAIDLPGFGDEPLAGRPPTMDTYVEAVRATLENVPRPRVILGHGIGGSIALTACQGRPDLADGLILHALVGADLERRLFPILMRPPVVRTFVKRAIASAPVRRLARGRLFGPETPADFTDQFLAAYGDCEAFEPMFDLLTPEWFHGLAPINTPALLLWGSDDRVLNARHVAAFRPILLDHRTEIIDGWGHFPMIDGPDRYGAEIARYARQLVDTR